MALTVSDISNKVRSLRLQYQERDQRMLDVLAVREGKMADVYPDMFPEGMEMPMVANFVDVAARDLAELLAPLPSFNALTEKTNNDSAKRKADRRTEIANHYVGNSDFESQMYYGADWYLSYALMPIIIEPDKANGTVVPRIENPIGSYPEYDRFNRCVSYTKVYKKSLGDLINDYPEHTSVFTQGQPMEFVDFGKEMELVKYYDKDQVLLFMPTLQNLLLERYENPISRVPVVCPRRPSINEKNPRGQFDDIIWVQIARARFAMLSLEAVEKSVQAPMVVPQDVDDFAFGPDAIMRTQNPAGVKRVGLELPTGAFTEQSVLAQEMRLGSRYPEGRSGQIDANIVTGQGVQALLGSFDTQVKAAQQIFAKAFEQMISICFEMDEKLFAGRKTVSAAKNGAPYKLTYDPATDIAGDYTIQARYGLMAGLDPSRALIFSLQALQAGLVSKEFIMRELPWQMNVSAEQEQIEIEKMRDMISSALTSTVQALPQMVATGQGEPLKLVEQLSAIIEKRKKGMPIEQAALEILTPKTPEVPAGVAAPVEQTPTPTATTAGSPETAPPAGPTEQPQAPQGAPATPPNIQDILSRLGG